MLSGRRARTSGRRELRNRERERWGSRWTPLCGAEEAGRVALAEPGGSDEELCVKTQAKARIAREERTCNVMHFVTLPRPVVPPLRSANDSVIIRMHHKARKCDGASFLELQTATVSCDSDGSGSARGSCVLECHPLQTTVGAELPCDPFRGARDRGGTRRDCQRQASLLRDAAGCARRRHSACSGGDTRLRGGGEAMRFLPLL